jgi:hypothetical protein
LQVGNVVVICSRKQLKGISQAFFETCVTNLVGYSNPALQLNFLAMIDPILQTQLPMVVAQEALQGTDFDQALAANVEALPLQLLSGSDFLGSKRSLEHFELPAALEAFLRRCLVVGHKDQVNQVLHSMFVSDRLCASYIDVFRRIMGDSAFLIACQENLNFGEKAISSVVKVAAVFGEAALHTPEFLESSLKKTASQEVAPYFWRLQSMGQDEKKLPLLASFMVANMEQIIVFSTSDRSLLNFVKWFVAMANRLGEGEKALEFVFKSMSPVIMNAPAAPPLNILGVLTKGRSTPFVTDKTRGYAWLSQMVEQVGLNALQAVVPNAPAEFVLDMIESKKTDLTQREVIRLFPQIKGHLLEDALGL